MKRVSGIAAVLMALALCASAAAAVAEFDLSDPPAAKVEDAEPGTAGGRFQIAQEFVPLEIILAALRSEYGGHQLSVGGPIPDGVGYVYQIKWLTEDGAVLYVTADAESGEVLSLEGE